MSFWCKLILRDDYIRSDGKSQVNLIAFINGKRTKLPTGEFIESQFWDKSKGRVKTNHPDATDLNIILQEMLSRANDIAREHRISRDEFTVNIFREEFLNPTARIDFLQYFEKTLAYKIKVTRPEGQANLKCHGVTLRKLRQFRKEILFCDLDWKLLETYEAWCRKVRKNCDNTIWRDVKDIRIYVNHALRDGIRFKNPFDIYKPRKVETKRTFLSKDELMKIIEYYRSPFATKSDRNVLRYFLFACFTGLRKSDVFALTWENVLPDRLMFFPKKVNDKPLIIPLREVALALLPIRAQYGPVFRHLTEQATNRALKRIARKLGISKKITFHVARHTFATGLLRLGIDIRVVSGLLGHRNIKTTMIYSHIEDWEKDNAIGVLDKAFKDEQKTTSES